MALQDNELARREGGRLEVRPAPIRIRWQLDDLVSADGHRFRCTFTCSVRAIESAAEQQLLAEVFLARSPVATCEAVAEHFVPAFRSAAAKTLGGRKGAEAQADGARQAVADALKAAGKPVAFSSGVELLAPYQVELSSPTLEQQQMEQMQRLLAEQRASGRLDHFRKAAELLAQFEAMRKSAPQLKPADVLRDLNPADQGETLKLLLMAAGQKDAARVAWAVAGPSLVSVDPAVLRAAQAPADKVGLEAKSIKATPLPAVLGPLRSVQKATVAGKPVLLVGARAGVFVVDPASPATAQAYADPLITSQKGFTQAVVLADRIWACHSDGGLVAWDVGVPDPPALVRRPEDLGGAGPRGIVVLDESRLAFASGNRLMTVTADGVVAIAGEQSGNEIIALLPVGEQLVTVSDDGLVVMRDRGSLAAGSESRPTGRIAAAGLLPWLGSWRILLASEDGPIFCIGLDDPLVTQYASRHRGMRSVAAGADLVVGLSPDRQRLVLWNSWDSRQPLADLYLLNLTRHRAADVEIG